MKRVAALVMTTALVVILLLAGGVHLTLGLLFGQALYLVLGGAFTLSAACSVLAYHHARH